MNKLTTDELERIADLAETALDNGDGMGQESMGWDHEQWEEETEKVRNIITRFRIINGLGM